MQQFRAVVFDLDGTLVDSLADIAVAVNSTLTTFGRPEHSLEAFNAMVGWGLRRLLEIAGGPDPWDDFEGAYAYLVEVYRARPLVHTRAYPGVADLLASLAGRVRLGVVSNKEDSLVRTIVAGTLPGVAFDAVVGARPGWPAKPDPRALVALLDEWAVAPADCAYLGDSDVDMQTAVRAGVVGCGALWGFRDEEELRRHGAAEVFSGAAAFGRWLEPLVLDKSADRRETKRGVKP